MHLAHSADGLTWRALNGDSAFFKPTVGKEKLTRDPSIVRASRRHLSHGVDGRLERARLRIRAFQGPHHLDGRDVRARDGARADRDEHVGARALLRRAERAVHDLLGDRRSRADTRRPTAVAAVGSTTTGMYYVTTTDFTTFSPTRLLYEHGFSVIDAAIIRDGSRYVMFLKDETERPPQKNIRLAYADRAEGPWSAPSAPITGDYWAEGPTALRVGGRWIVYFDRYREHKLRCPRVGRSEAVDRRHREPLDARRHPPRHRVRACPRPTRGDCWSVTGGERVMIRKAFRMAVNPGQHEEYERRHSPIWQELQDVLAKHGAHRLLDLSSTTPTEACSATSRSRTRRGGTRSRDRRVPPLVDVHARHHADEPRRQPAQRRAARGLPPRLTDG